MKVLFFVITFGSLLFAEMGIVLTNVNIREEASINSLKVGLLIEDDVVDILGVIPNAENPRWYKIDRGYVYASTIGKLNSQPFFVSAEIVKRINIREKPSVRSLKLGEFQKGESVELLSAIPNKFNTIWYETDKGYVYANAIDLKVKKPLETEDLKVNKVLEAKELKVNKALESEDLKVPAIALKNANIREEPSIDSMKLGLLKEGERVKILKAIPNKENPKWYKTNKGYIYAKLLSSDKLKKPKTKKVRFLTTVELKELLIDNARVGKTRYFKNGEYFRSKFNTDKTVSISIYTKSGEKIRDEQARWIISNNAFCVVENYELTDTSCRKVFKNKNGVYVSVLMKDKNVWAKFLME